MTQANNARVRTILAGIEEEIELYRQGKYLEGKENEEAYPIEKDESGNLKTIKDMLSEEEINNLPQELKEDLLEISKPDGNEIYGFENINYDKFYKLDTEEISSAKDYKDKLLIYVDGDTYKVIHIDGITYVGEKIYVIIPIDNEQEPTYVTTSYNTYKLYGDGTVKVVGQLNSNSGITSEESSEIAGIQELDVEEICKEYRIETDKNVETEDEIAKSFGLKKITFNLGTAYIIDSNNDLWSWGQNEYNKLGQGNSYTLTKPTKILEGRTEGASNVKAKEIYTARYNTCVIDTENRVWICGRNDNGALGQGNTNIYDNYVQIKIKGQNLDGTTVKKVLMSNSIYVNDTIIWLNNGKVYGAGKNSKGNFGLGNIQEYNNFTELKSFENADQIKFNDMTTYVIKGTELYACGSTENARIPTSSQDYAQTTLIKVADNIEEMSDIPEENLYKSTEGKLFQIGYCYADSSGKTKFVKEIMQVLNEDGTEFIDKEAKINGKYVLSNGKEYVASTVLENEEYKIKLRYVKEIDEFLNNVEQRGLEPNYVKNGKIYIVYRPDITGIGKRNILNLKEVATNISYIYGCGTNFNMVDRNNDVYEGINNKLNDSNINKKAKKIISSIGNRYILTTDGKIYSQGEGFGGGWGNLNKSNTYVLMKYENGEEVTNVKDIFTSKNGWTFIYLTNNNKLYFTGYYKFCLPGVGTSYFPIEVKSEILDTLNGKIDRIEYGGKETGGGVTFIITTEGEVYSIASDSNLSGNGKVTSDFEKLDIDGKGTKVRDIKVNNDFILATMQTGEVYAWGYNTYGLMGEGYETGRVYSTPQKLDLPSMVESTEIGDGFAIFITTTGQVYGIGRNEFGQLGTGDNKSTNVFVRCTELEK